MSVGVVLGLETHVGMMQRSGVVPVKQFSVDHAGVGLQRNVFLQPVVVTTGHYGTLLRDGSFFLDDGSHRYRLLYICCRWTICARPITPLRTRGQPDLPRNLVELFNHGAYDVFHGLGAGEFVGVGEEIAFQALRFGGEV